MKDFYYRHYKKLVGKTVTGISQDTGEGKTYRTLLFQGFRERVHCDKKPCYNMPVSRTARD